MITHLTNMVTGKTLDVTPAEPLSYTMLLGCYVLDDRDYEAISAGLTGQWQEDYVLFNVTDVEASFPFAKALFYDIVDHSGPEVEVFDDWTLWPAKLPLRRQDRISATRNLWKKAALLPSTMTNPTAQNSAQAGNTCLSSKFWMRRNW